jgi:hypothetical protein
MSEENDEGASKASDCALDDDFEAESTGTGVEEDAPADSQAEPDGDAEEEAAESEADDGPIDPDFEPDGDGEEEAAAADAEEDWNDEAADHPPEPRGREEGAADRPPAHAPPDAGEDGNDEAADQPPGDAEEKADGGAVAPASDALKEDFESDFAEAVSSSTLITEVTFAVQPPAGTGRPRFRLPRPPEEMRCAPEELRRLFGRMMETRKCPPLAALSPLRRWIEGEMLSVVDGCDYDYGARLKEGEAMLAAFLKSSEAASAREEQRKALADRMDRLKECLSTTDQSFDNEIRNWTDSQKARAKKLNLEHEEDIEEFEKHWANPENLLAFNKPSPRLIMLRKTEARLAIMKQFDRAKRIKREADELEQTEAAEAQNRAVAVMRLEFANLETKHSRELECLQGFTERVDTKLQRQKTERIKALQLVMTRLSTIAVPAIFPSRKKPGIFLDPIWPESPRPVAHRHTARQMPPSKPLGIAGIKVWQYVKPKKQPAKRTS